MKVITSIKSNSPFVTGVAAELEILDVLGRRYALFRKFCQKRFHVAHARHQPLREKPQRSIAVLFKALVDCLQCLQASL
jgi:hypothetical protein